MNHLGASPLRPLLRILEKAFQNHRARREENEAWRAFDEASALELGRLGFFHARDLAAEYAGEKSQRAHWPMLSHFFEEAGRVSGDLAFVASLAAQTSALELWRRLRGEEMSFVEDDRLIAFAPGPDARGVGRLDETYLVGGCSPALNVSRATHFIVRAEVKGAPALVAFGRDEATLTADLNATFPGMWASSAGELALHGSEVLAGDVKLVGAEANTLVDEIRELESLLIASAALGVIKGLPEAAPFSLVREMISLEGVIELQREACYGEAPANLAVLQAVAFSIITAELPEAIEINSFDTAKLKRDVASLKLFLNGWPAAATSIPATLLG